MCFHTMVWPFHNSDNHSDLGERQPGKLKWFITAGVGEGWKAGVAQLLYDACLYHLERVQENKI